MWRTDVAFFFLSFFFTNAPLTANWLTNLYPPVFRQPLDLKHKLSGQKKNALKLGLFHFNQAVSQVKINDKICIWSGGMFSCVDACV